MGRISWIAVAAVILWPQAARTQEYTIKFAKAAAGQQFQVKSENTTNVQFKLLDGNGTAVMDNTEHKTHLFSFHETALQTGPGGELVRLEAHLQEGPAQQGRRSADVPVPGRDGAHREEGRRVHVSDR